MKKITLQQAYEIAEREIHHRVETAEELNGYDFSPVQLSRENSAFWIFSAGSQRLQEAGFIPGAIFVCVDKTDGQLWGTEAQEQYFSTVNEPASLAA